MAVPEAGNALVMSKIARERIGFGYNSASSQTNPIYMSDLHRLSGGNSSGSGNSYPAVNTLNPIQAKISIVGRDNIANSRGSWVNTELPIGDFYRPIEAGTYDILFEADCYQPYTLPSQVITDGTTVDLGDVFLTPVSPTVPNSLTASSITTTTATISWSATSGGTSYDVRYRVSTEEDKMFPWTGYDKIQ